MGRSQPAGGPDAYRGGCGEYARRRSAGRENGRQQRVQNSLIGVAARVRFYAEIVGYRDVLRPLGLLRCDTVRIDQLPCDRRIDWREKEASNFWSRHLRKHKMCPVDVPVGSELQTTQAECSQRRRDFKIRGSFHALDSKAQEQLDHLVFTGRITRVMEQIHAEGSSVWS